jgi:hypothetical protein
LENRFAAKEAVIKAHRSRRLTFHDIWIYAPSAGEGGSKAPLVFVRDEDGKGKGMGWERPQTCQVNISHDGGIEGWAVATCLAVDYHATWSEGEREKIVVPKIKSEDGMMEGTESRAGSSREEGPSARGDGAMGRQDAATGSSEVGLLMARLEMVEKQLSSIMVPKINAPDRVPDSFGRDVASLHSIHAKKFKLPKNLKPLVRKVEQLDNSIEPKSEEMMTIKKVSRGRAKTERQPSDAAIGASLGVASAMPDMFDEMFEDIKDEKSGASVAIALDDSVGTWDFLEPTDVSFGEPVNTEPELKDDRIKDLQKFLDDAVDATDESTVEGEDRDWDDYAGEEENHDWDWGPEDEKRR